MGILGSHNTFTYRRPKQWWLRPFAFIARCQNIDYIKQYEQCVRCFDFRIHYNDDCGIEFRHGMFRYDASDLLDILKFCDEHHMYIRFVLEDRKYLHTNVVNHDYESRFISLCEYVERTYPNITFWCGRNLYTWDVLHNFRNNIVDVGYYSSVTSLFHSTNKLLSIIDDWCPKIYASRCNKKNISNVNYHSDNTIVSFDFIGTDTNL